MLFRTNPPRWLAGPLLAQGVEKNWSKAFQEIYTQPPAWHQGSYGPAFYPNMFANDLNAMLLQAGSVLSSAPRSPGGSGFGWRGSSGGGGGGDAL